LQIEAVRKGLSRLIPKPFLNTVSATDLETWVCGKKEVDFDLLKRHTRYAGTLNENSDLIKNFWEVLNSFSTNEKLRFVKFCWAQEILPANDEEFDRNMFRFMIKPATHCKSNPDKYLPKADTCFFNFELPNYSNKEIMK
jgi:hypothetical protein